MSHCYQFEKQNYKHGILNSCVDATYVIHLKNNGRIENIETQLEKYKPTSTVYILINEGYKKCSKNLHKKHPAIDLIDCYYTIFEHAKQANYDNILILEDDFEFSSDFKNPETARSLCNFIHSMKNQRFIYYLGVLSLSSFPLFRDNTRKLFMGVGTHACIYSRSFQEKCLALKKSSIHDWDVFINLQCFDTKRYIYNKPLCYQLFPETENSKQWMNPLGLATLSKFCLRNILHLDRQYEPGFSFLYTFSIFVFLFFFCLFLVILLCIGRFLYNNVKTLLSKKSKKMRK